VDIGVLTGKIEIEDTLSTTLESAAQKIEKFSEKFENVFGAMIVGSAAAVTAIAAVSGAIITLGQRGADINDVSDTLEHFAGSAEAAEEAMAGLRKGTKDTVGDFDLMKTGSRLLSAGVKLTAGDFETLGTAAFVMQNRGLGPTKEMLDLVSGAMITGRTRSLQMKLGIVDAKDATQELADKLGVEVNELSKAQKAEATRTQILAMLSKANKDAGTQVRDFGEQFEFAQTQIENWFDELSQGVAKSTHVMGALDAIGKAFSDNFGGAGKTAMETIQGWIDKFADAVTKWAPIIIGWIKNITDAILGLWNTINTIWNSIPDWFKNIAFDAGIAATAVWGLNSAFLALTGSSIVSGLASVGGAWAGIATAVGVAIDAVKGFIAAMALTYQLGGVGAILSGIGSGIASVFASPALVGGVLVLALGGLTQAIYKAYEAWKSGRDMWEYFLGKTQPEDMDFLTRHVRQLGYAITGWEKLHDIVSTTTPALGSVAKAGGQGESIFSAPAAVPPPPDTGLEGAAAAAAKRVKALYDSLFGSDIKKKAQDLEAAVTQFTVKGLVPTTQQLEALAKEADSVMEKGGKLGQNTAMLVAKYDLLHTGVFQVSDGLAKQKLTLGGVSGEWVNLKMSVAPIPQDIFPKLINTNNDVVLGINKQVNIVALLKKEYADLKFNQHIQELEDYSAILKTIGQIMPGIAGTIVSGLGNVAAAWAQAEVMSKKYLETSTRATGTEKALGIAQGISQVAGSTSSGGIGSRTAGGALAGAGAGALVGSMILPGIGTAIGAAVGAIGGAITGLVRGIVAAMNDGRKAVTAFADTFTDGFVGLHEQLSVLGPQGEQLWKNLSGVGQGDKEGAAKAIKATQDALQGLTTDVQKYNLTWVNMDPAMAMKNAKIASDDLLTSFNRLKSAGYSTQGILVGMSDDLNKWIIDAMRAGVKIPAAMEPIIKKMIETNTITMDAAKAMLGLEDSSVPSLDQITEAAGRYGLALDDLGPKVQQISITNQANQIVQDFNTLTAAGVPFSAMMHDTVTQVTDAGGEVHDVVSGMHHDIQQMVDQSTGPLGIKLPDSMKPIIQQLIDAGGDNGLVDQFGNALTDLSQLNFDEPLSAMVDKLLDKLDQLIDKITGPGGVTDAFAGLAQNTNPSSASTTTTDTGTPAYNYRTPTGGSGTPSTQSTGTPVVIPVTVTANGEVVGRAVTRQLVRAGA
jgi:hypothetical protein